MNTTEKLKRMLLDSGLTEYRLARKCGLSQSTVTNIFSRNTVPSIATLGAICEGFGITLSQFFAEEGEVIELTPDLKRVFDCWVNLTPYQKGIALQLLEILKGLPEE